VVKRRGAVCAVLLVGGLALAACGIPTQQAPSSISSNRVPVGLTNPGAGGTPPTQPNAKSEVRVTISLLDSDNALAPVDRYVQVPAPLQSILTAMLGGPTQNEENDGLYTAIPSDVAVLSPPTVQGSVVTVNFNDAFGEITGSDAALAVAQVVATVVAWKTKPGTSVLFEIDGQPTSVPTSSGAQVSGPVFLWQVIPSSSTP
jgi:spore germination protein GerM